MVSLLRNSWSVCSGIVGQFASEWLVSLLRNGWSVCSGIFTSKESKHELFTFGTGFLLNDLLTYARLNISQNKIIFVGDPAQLPPVGDNQSLALDPNYFKTKLNLSVQTAELVKVVRQERNLILKNAEKIRNLIFSDKRYDLKFDFDSNCFVQSKPIDFIQQFTDSFPIPKVGDGVIIVFSNGQCYHNNVAVRGILFPEQNNLVSGDIVLINNNNYHSYNTELFNGDLAQVVEVDQIPLTQSAPVMVDAGGRKEKKTITLNFRKIKIRLPHFPEEISCLVHYDLLNSVNRDLTIDEMKALYINFVIRFNSQQKSRKESGLLEYKIGSEEFKTALRFDPYFNALRIKFGYSITCHKAQGGEWDKVFIDYSGRVSLKTEPLKWCYTATTRARQAVNCINAPNFGRFQKLSFKTIGQIGNFPTNAISFLGIATSPFHHSDAHTCKNLKYWEVLEKLENTGFKIKDVFSPKNGFLERYYIEIGDNKIAQLDGYHNRSGYFTQPFKVINLNEIEPNAITYLETIFNEPLKKQYLIDWQPEEPFLKELNSIVQQACEESEVIITNIVKTGNYDVSYYFITDSICSFIQFYYNGQNQFTSAIPKKYSIQEDEKLKMIISKIESYAI